MKSLIIVVLSVVVVVNFINFLAPIGNAAIEDAQRTTQEMRYMHIDSHTK